MHFLRSTAQSLVWYLTHTHTNKEAAPLSAHQASVHILIMEPDMRSQIKNSAYFCKLYRHFSPHDGHETLVVAAVYSADRQKKPLFKRDILQR